jgi:hypothetical protein
MEGGGEGAESAAAAAPRRRGRRHRRSASPRAAAGAEDRHVEREADVGVAHLCGGRHRRGRRVQPVRLPRPRLLVLQGRGGGHEGDAVQVGEVGGGDDQDGREPQPGHVAAL